VVTGQSIPQKFIDFYRRRGFEVFYVYSGLEVDIKWRIYKDFKSQFLDSFKDDEGVHMHCIRDQIKPDTDELALIVELQEQFTPTLTIFIDGDVLLRTFIRQALPGKPRLLGKNYAVFIMIDFIYRDMNLGGVLLHPIKRRQVRHLLFHNYFFKYLDLLDGALVSDENLVRECSPSKHIPFGDVIHFKTPPGNDDPKKQFFAKAMRQYDDFLAQNPGKDVILQFGELEERKGYDFLLRLVAENSDLVLVRAGRTKPNYSIKWDSVLYKEELMIQNRIFEINMFIDSQELIDKLFRSVRFLLFAYKDHFRTSIMMPLALSYGKPVMVPSIGLLAWRVKHHKVGSVFEHKCYEDFAEEFAKFHATYETYLENGEKYYASDFSDEAFDRRLDQISNSHSSKQSESIAPSAPPSEA